METEEEKGGHLRGETVWGPNLSVVSEQRFLSFSNVSIIADFIHLFKVPLLKTSNRTFQYIFFSCCYGAKGAVNIIFFLPLAFNYAKNWIDSSVLVVSLVHVFFCIIVVKHCLCLSVIHVHILSHTGARTGVKL